MVRNGAGIDLCESRESKMPSQLSSRRAIFSDEDDSIPRDSEREGEREFFF